MATAPPSALANFGRAWNISITTQGQTYTLASGTNETLRVQFEIDTQMMMIPWTATVTIWNLSNSTVSSILGSAPTAQTLLKYGVQIVGGEVVTISAGYQYGPSGTFQPSSNIIYQGQVLQAIWTRDEDVVDNKLQLRCITGISQFLEFANSSLGPGANNYTALQQITTLAPNGIDANAQRTLTQQTYPGSLALWGRPSPLISDILKQNHLNGWIGPDGLHVRQYGADDFSTPAYTYGVPQFGASSVGAPASTNTVSSAGTAPPNTSWTIIGSPQMTQLGVTFRVLMDSRPKIGDIVAFAPGTVVVPYPVSYPGLPPATSQSGAYAIYGMRYLGDTRGRGNDWFTEITGMVQQFFNLFAQSASSSPAHG